MIRSGRFPETASRPGLWAGGNVVDSRAQAITAAGMGAAAAFALNHELVDEETERDLAAYRAAGRSPESPVPRVLTRAAPEVGRRRNVRARPLNRSWW
ncbi:hypothetical protein [Streptomyces sparsogenes]|uniref:hypothetical protein n=1 Tax=Streptomyces sparsogenes TaxID=67365 RepID=UPI0033CFC720